MDLFQIKDVLPVAQDYGFWAGLEIWDRGLKKSHVSYALKNLKIIATSSGICW